jgi:uracil-DNA glycosylase
VYKNNIAKINEYLSHCLEVTQGKVNIFPYPDDLYNGLNMTPLNEIKLVVLGQDPYFNFEMIDGKMVPQGMGLSFSVLEGINIPPSLVNIYKNLQKFGHTNFEPKHGNLTFWAKQGCLLLNTSLTVQAKCPNGHEEKWKDITDAFISFVSDKTENVVFMLWGAPSLKKLSLIDNAKHKILISSHPSPLSANNKLRQYESFMNTDHFGDCNKYLKENGKSEILWQIA